MRREKSSQTIGETRTAERKKGRYLRKSLSVWWFEYRRILLSSRWLVLTIISMFILWFYMKEILLFARVYDLKLCPAALPFLFEDGTFSSLGILLLTFMVSVFPITDHLQQNVLLRGGNFSWVSGQMLTAVSLVFTWLLEMQLFLCLIALDRLELSGWGKVWGTFASGAAARMNYFSTVGISIDIIMRCSPLQAILLSMLFAGLMGILFGEFIFCVDGLCRNYIGEIILSLWGLGWLVISSFKPLSKIAFLRKLSPANWLSVSRYSGNPALMWRTLLVMVGAILFFYLVNQLLVKRKIIHVE